MKTKTFCLITGILMLSIAQAKPVNYYSTLGRNSASQVEDTGGRDSQKCKPHQQNGNHAEDIWTFLLENIKLYSISGKQVVVSGYISGKASKNVEYMGFKVGDSVTWQPMAAQNTAIVNKYRTGIIDMLDSDKCYIKVTHTNMVAVKPYEDIVKMTP